MKEPRTSRSVLYEALWQLIEPYKDAIISESNVVYNLSPEEIKDCESDEYLLSDLLDYACSVALEEECWNGTGKKIK